VDRQQRRDARLHRLRQVIVGGDLVGEQRVAAHSTAPRYQLRFRYGIGDIVVWDNAALLHSATLTDPADPRTLWRITMLEDSAAAAAPEVLAPTFAGGTSPR